MAKQENKKKQSATQDFIDVVDVKDNVVILKDGSLRSVLRVGSMNFELKSSDEQTAIIIAFQNFLNSIDFPLQIVISSRKLDIDPYLKSLDRLSENETNELLKIQINDYTRFIKSLTDLSNIMDKEFYVIIPFYITESSGSVKGGILDSFKSIFAPSKFVQTLSDEQLNNYNIQLRQRVEMVIDGLSGFGLSVTALSGKDLINTYHRHYNPEAQ